MVRRPGRPARWWASSGQQPGATADVAWPRQGWPSQVAAGIVRWPAPSWWLLLCRL